MTKKARKPLTGEQRRKFFSMCGAAARNLGLSGREAVEEYRVIRQGECDSPLRGQSHSPCLITLRDWTSRFRCVAAEYGIIRGKRF